jgi:hypothetical protein
MILRLLCLLGWENTVAFFFFLVYFIYMIINDDHSNYNLLGIVLYGSLLKGVTNKSDIQKHKLFGEFGMRSIITPQNIEKSFTHSIVLRGYGIDNGAFINHTNNTEFNKNKFLKVCRFYGKMSDWIAIPDVMCDKESTLKQSSFWIRRLRKECPDTKLLIVWQDGMTRKDLLPFVRDGIGVFIGGSTNGKLSAISMIGDLCLEFNEWSHCGRVNTLKRTIQCINSGIRSCDGSGYSKFIPNFQPLFNYKKLCLIRKKSKKSFPYPLVDTSIIKKFEDRLNYFNIESSFYDYIYETNTDYVGMRKTKTRSQSWYLDWTKNQQFLYNKVGFKIIKR